MLVTTMNSSMFAHIGKILQNGGKALWTSLENNNFNNIYSKCDSTSYVNKLKILKITNSEHFKSVSQVKYYFSNKL